jgi:hypothetical protein
MNFNELYPEYAKTPQTLGPHQYIYVTDDLVQSWARYMCLICNNNATGWRHVANGTRVAVCSIECLAEYNLNTLEAFEQAIINTTDIIESLDIYDK